MSISYDAGEIPPILLRHRLRIAREYAHLEQEELAAVIGVSRNTVGNAESGKRAPRRITVNAWALACRVPRQWLLDGTAPGQPVDKRVGEISHRIVSAACVRAA